MKNVLSYRLLTLLLFSCGCASHNLDGTRFYSPSVGTLGFDGGHYFASFSKSQDNRTTFSNSGLWQRTGGDLTLTDWRTPQDTTPRTVEATLSSSDYRWLIRLRGTNTIYTQALPEDVR